MSQTTTMTVRISGALSEFVASNVGENGSYENISEYVRDLIRRDKERVEREAFDRLKGELTRAQLGAWAAQHYQYVSQFPRWCATVACCARWPPPMGTPAS